MAGFFLKRPVFAWVLAIAVMLAGLLALRTLPVALHPDIALPQIGVSAQYPGASAEDAEQSVTQIIERSMKGLDRLLYMHSSSDSSGSVEIFFTFEAGTNPDTAQMQVQNKLQQAMPQLPETVQRQGVEVSETVENSFLTVAFYTEHGSMSAGSIADYAASYLADPLSRVPGVGSVSLYAGQNAMRIWLDPEKMRQFSLNPQDVAEAVREQNSQTAGGQTGAAPAPPGQETAVAVSISSLLQTVEDFERISLRTAPDGHVLRLGDVARVELNEETFFGSTRFNGHPGAGMAFKLAPGANVLATTQAIKAELASLSRFFPPGLKYAFADDRAPVVQQSLLSVLRTLAEAAVLVAGIIFLFLGSLRAACIPVVAVPVVLLGVLAVLWTAGFSINTLTLFGMVLSIGLLVDDAVVVTENAERLMRTEGLSPREAAAKCMRQITGALTGVAGVVMAVFLPLSFMQGSTGVIYRQFSVTIVAAMALSVLVAVILSPTMCACLLRPGAGEPTGLAGRFRSCFDRLARRYAASVRSALRSPWHWFGAYAAVVALCAVLFALLPTAFLPDEDQGTLYVDVQLPPGATLERTEKVLAEIDRYFREDEKDAIESVMTVSGWGFSGSGQNAGMAFPMLKDWSKRGPGQGAFELMERAQAHFDRLPGARIAVMAPPAVMELATSGGFDMELLDRGALGHAAHLRAKDELIAAASRRPEIGGVRYGGMDDAEQYRLAIDTGKAGAMGLSRGVVNGAVNAYWAGEYVNDFNDKGRTKKVIIQAEPAFRTAPDDFARYHVRNAGGAMVPFPSFLAVQSSTAPPRLTRYQGIPSLKIEGEAAPGASSGEAMAALEQAASSL
ncbi:MAG: efflux RND transporter permease subunit, partial [Desulfovibrio sp.]|nr:efflux RND transporter permease subunit [Desulfovibrio sp.]